MHPGRSVKTENTFLRHDDLDRRFYDAEVSYKKLEQFRALEKSPLRDVMVTFAGTFAYCYAPLEHSRTMNRFAKACIR